MEEHPEARQIIEKLHKAGFIAYYAGGWVRDFLLKHPSDDIDIATNAPPETIQSLFEKTIPVGIAFGIVLVVIRGKQYEVATFRKDLEYKDGRRPTKIAFSSAVEDAKRRDFTINGMFYDPIEEKVLDFVGGKEDLEKKVIRAIGDPHERFSEDRLRMIRAVRLSSRFNFSIDPATEKAIVFHAKELFPAVAIERIVQEFEKMASFGGLFHDLLLLHDLHLLDTIFPSLQSCDKKIVEKRLTPTQDFPPTTPLVVTLITLLDLKELSEKLSLCKYLKLPRYDEDFVTFLDKTNALFKEETQTISDRDWAHFYAHPFAEKALFIFSCFLPPSEKKPFLQREEKRKKNLNFAIKRILEKNPVIRASHLKKEGIAPGEKMGLLLREAESISINSRLEEPEEVLKILKSSPTWTRL